MALSTMTNLRGLHPLALTAAILPRHALRFNIPGVSWLEPSAASVEPVEEEEALVHGVLYRLCSEDFLRVCRTEGVPWSYTLHRCRPIPYRGDGQCAGQSAADAAVERRRRRRETTETTNATRSGGSGSVAAWTLRAARAEWRHPGTDIPPSQSYLNVLLRGAREFQLDADYLEYLQSLQVAPPQTPGTAEGLLKWAEIMAPFRRTTPP